MFKTQFYLVHGVCDCFGDAIFKSKSQLRGQAPYTTTNTILFPDLFIVFYLSRSAHYKVYNIVR